MSGHSDLAPSSAKIWGHCPGSVALRKTLPPEVESEAARDGTAAHEVARAMVDNLDAFPGASEEMLDGARTYAAAIALVNATRSPVPVQLEAEVKAERIHPQCWGTVDAYCYDPATEDLQVWDYKYGFGPVEAYENEQLICYAAGIMDAHDINGYLDQRTSVTLTIVQPRAFHNVGPIRSWKLKASDLRPYINRLHEAAKEALGLTPRTHTGPHCKYCPARYLCASANSLGMQLLETTDGISRLEMSPEQIGATYARVLMAEERLKFLRTGYEAQVESLLKAGTPVPGFRLQESFGRETWLVPVGEVHALGDMLGVDLRDVGVLTPAQARKKGLDSTICKSYAGKPSRGMTVTEDSTTQARRVFDGK